MLFCCYKYVVVIYIQHIINSTTKQLSAAELTVQQIQKDFELSAGLSAGYKVIYFLLNLTTQCTNKYDYRARYGIE